MAIRATINGTNFDGIDTIKATDGTNTATAVLTETGVIPTPTGMLNITANGTVDVTNYASALVNVPTSGGASVEHGTFTPTEQTLTQAISTSLTELHGFVFYVDSSDTAYNSSPGYRNCAMGISDFVNNRKIYTGSNSSGTNVFAAIAEGEATSTTGHEVSLENGVITLTTQNAGQSGYLQPCRHVFIAW